MWKPPLGAVLGALLALTASCGDSKDGDDDDAGSGGADDATGGTAGHTGSAGTKSSGGRSGAGTAGRGAGGRSGAGTGGRGGSSGGSRATGGVGGTNAGEAGQGTAGASANGGEHNAQGGTAGSVTAGEGGEPAAGSGGEAPAPTGCERDPTGAVLIDADFSTDVFADSAWSRSDSSVSLSGGVVAIATDGSVDDYIEVALTDATLPLVLELRQRTTESSPVNEVMPVTELPFNGVWLKMTYLADAGWMLSNSSTFSGSQVRAPAQGEWSTTRILLDSGKSELCVKKDGDSTFTRVTGNTLTLPAALDYVHVRQAWDYAYEMSTLKVQRP